MELQSSERQTPLAQPLAQDEVERVRRLAAVLVLGWTVALVFAGAYTHGLLSAAPFLTLLVVASLAGLSNSGPSSLHLYWPLAAWPALYQGAVEVVRAAPDRYWDPWFRAFDHTWQHWLGITFPWHLGGPLEEGCNLFYVSFYVGVPLTLLLARRFGGTRLATRFGLALVGTFIACGIIWVVLPTGGWYAHGSPQSAPWGPFTAISRFIYFVNPHAAAAFPSSHVAVSVAAVVVLRRARLPAWLWIWPLGIAIATIYGQYHYLLDAVGGWALGVGVATWALRTEGLTALPALLDRD